MRRMEFVTLLNSCTSLEHLVIPFDRKLNELLVSPTLKYLDFLHLPTANLEPSGVLTFPLNRSDEVRYGLQSHSPPRLCGIRDIYDISGDIAFKIPPSVDFKVDLHYPGIRWVAHAGAIDELQPLYTFPFQHDPEDGMGVDELGHEVWLSDDSDRMVVDADYSGPGSSEESDSESSSPAPSSGGSELWWDDPEDEGMVLDRDAAIQLFEASLDA
ncbi:hypothetical protein AX16_010713 [Volvariella volvacea WC 439]|nr:hypothetical protein AX16_010713 [Volvariella volvacea WC 439]